MLGFKYIGHVLRELFGSNTRGGAAAAIRLDDDVKTSIADFLGQKMKSRRIGKEWSSVFDENGIDASDLPYNSAPLLVSKDVKSDAYAFVHRVMIWQIATWYCELVEQCKEESTGCSETQAPAADTSREKNRRVAIALSKYCAYLVASAPELLPGLSKDTKDTFDRIGELPCDEILCILERHHDVNVNALEMGVYLGKLVCEWLPALLWVQTLLYAAAALL